MSYKVFLSFYFLLIFNLGAFKLGDSLGGGLGYFAMIKKPNNKEINKINPKIFYELTQLNNFGLRNTDLSEFVIIKSCSTLLLNNLLLNPVNPNNFGNQNICDFDKQNKLSQNNKENLITFLKFSKKHISCIQSKTQNINKKSSGFGYDKSDKPSIIIENSNEIPLYLFFCSNNKKKLPTSFFY